MLSMNVRLDNQVGVRVTGGERNVGTVAASTTSRNESPVPHLARHVPSATSPTTLRQSATARFPPRCAPSRILCGPRTRTRPSRHVATTTLDDSQLVLTLATTYDSRSTLEPSVMLCRWESTKWLLGTDNSRMSHHPRRASLPMGVLLFRSWAPLFSVCHAVTSAAD